MENKSNILAHHESLKAEITSLKSQLAEKDAEIEKVIENCKQVCSGTTRLRNQIEGLNRIIVNQKDIISGANTQITRLRELVVDIDWISEGLYMDDWGAVNFKYPMARLEKKLKEIREALGAKE